MTSKIEGEENSNALNAQNKDEDFVGVGGTSSETMDPRTKHMAPWRGKNKRLMTFCKSIGKVAQGKVVLGGGVMRE